MRTVLLYLFVFSNLGIVAGYLFVATTVMPRAGVNTLRTKVGGVLFFFTCAITHFELALHALIGDGLTLDDMLSWHMIIVHVVQVISVWMFVTGLYVEFVKWGPWGKHWDKMLEDERY